MSAHCERYYYKSGSLQRETWWANRKKNGVQVQYYDGGGVSAEVPYVDDKKHGLARGFCIDGDVNFETPYSNGLKHGIRKSHYPGLNYIKKLYYIWGEEVTKEEWLEFDK